LVRRYVAKRGGDVVLDAMRRADGWFMCRVGFVDPVRAAGRAAADAVKDE
jgi:hypothetical protein